MVDPAAALPRATRIRTATRQPLPTANPLALLPGFASSRRRMVAKPFASMTEAHRVSAPATLQPVRLPNAARRASEALTRERRQTAATATDSDAATAQNTTPPDPRR